MIELAMKCLGFGKLLTQIDALNGYKVYIAGTAKMLLGISGMVGGVASLLMSVQPGAGLSGLIDAVKGPQFLAAKSAICAGWYATAGGLADIGTAHKAEKSANMAVNIAVAQSPAPQPAQPQP